MPGYADEIQTNTSDGWYHFENVTVPPGSNVVSFYVFTRQLSTNDGHLWQYASAPARTVVQDNSVDQVTAVQASTPKIVETGDRSGPEGVERAAQSGKIDYNIQSGTREIRLYSRPVGTQDPWTIVKSWTRNPGTDELWVQPLWGSLEYHTAILEPTGAWVTSPVTTIAPGPAPEIFDDFSGTSIDQTKWALRCTTIGQTDPVLPPFGDPAECGHKEDYERHSWSAVQVQQQGGGSYTDLRVLRDSRPGAACDLSRCPCGRAALRARRR
ncbi:hypothetical protein KM427_22515 [Nocardioides sp. LMS-CY]|uniref:hypothetical protein n=1 Tax=Nocardioides sp. (strain LMS-CY) TaxID=2840457 RepID=UPI001C007899|nr:hypothetical protein [Nocardioides sp. LMS-CY]QWF21667.1 hypothetical protein KM427_22515 [Nocardioides sp. LMS-CY]